MNRISIIIPTYNSGEYLEEHLQTIRELTSRESLEAEIIVVDAGSKDVTVKIAGKYADEVIVVPRVSRGKARNIGAEIAKNETLAFIDSDCRITADWVRFVKNLCNLNSTMISGPAVLYKSDTAMGEAVRNLLSDPILTLNSCTFSFRKSRRERLKEVPASNLLISKEMFKKVGGFPDLNFNEDTLFCKKFRNHGGEIIYDPNLKCFHHKHFDSLRHFAKYFFMYGKGYAKIAKRLGIIRRYGFISLIFLLALTFVGMNILLNIVNFLYLLYIFCFLFLALFAYSVIRNRRFHSVMIPFLFFILLLSYLGGFYFGILRTQG